jgi:hypothetical protein
MTVDFYSPMRNDNYKAADSNRLAMSPTLNLQSLGDTPTQAGYIDSDDEV